jgi:GntR family transcriptional regulator
MIDWGGNWDLAAEEASEPEAACPPEEECTEERRVDRRSPEPEYQQLAEILKERISAGKWRSGQLPSVRQLQQEYDVGRDTVLRAIHLLKDQDVVFTVPGRGTYVKRETDRE